MAGDRRVDMALRAALLNPKATETEMRTSLQNADMRRRAVSGQSRPPPPLQLFSSQAHLNQQGVSAGTGVTALGTPPSSSRSLSGAHQQQQAGGYMFRSGSEGLASGSFQQHQNQYQQHTPMMPIVSRTHSMDGVGVNSTPSPQSGIGGQNESGWQGRAPPRESSMAAIGTPVTGEYYQPATPHLHSISEAVETGSSWAANNEARQQQQQSRVKKGLFGGFKRVAQAVKTAASTSFEVTRRDSHEPQQQYHQQKQQAVYQQPTPETASYYYNQPEAPDNGFQPPPPPMQQSMSSFAVYAGRRESGSHQQQQQQQQRVDSLHRFGTPPVLSPHPASATQLGMGQQQQQQASKLHSQSVELVRDRAQFGGNATVPTSPALSVEARQLGKEKSSGIGRKYSLFRKRSERREASRRSSQNSVVSGSHSGLTSPANARSRDSSSYEMNADHWRASRQLSGSMVGIDAMAGSAAAVARATPVSPVLATSSLYPLRTRSTTMPLGESPAGSPLLVAPETLKKLDVEITGSPIFDTFPRHSAVYSESGFSESADSGRRQSVATTTGGGAGGSVKAHHRAGSMLFRLATESPAGGSEEASEDGNGGDGVQSVAEKPPVAAPDAPAGDTETHSPAGDVMIDSQYHSVVMNADKLKQYLKQVADKEEAAEISNLMRLVESNKKQQEVDDSQSTKQPANDSGIQVASEVAGLSAIAPAASTSMLATASTVLENPDSEQASTHESVMTPPPTTPAAAAAAATWNNKRNSAEHGRRVREPVPSSESSGSRPFSFSHSRYSLVNADGSLNLMSFQFDQLEGYREHLSTPSLTDHHDHGKHTAPLLRLRESSGRFFGSGSGSGGGSSGESVADNERHSGRPTKLMRKSRQPESLHLFGSSRGASVEQLVISSPIVSSPSTAATTAMGRAGSSDGFVMQQASMVGSNSQSRPSDASSFVGAAGRMPVAASQSSPFLPVNVSVALAEMNGSADGQLGMSRQEAVSLQRRSNDAAAATASGGSSGWRMYGCKTASGTNVYDELFNGSPAAQSLMSVVMSEDSLPPSALTAAGSSGRRGRHRRAASAFTEPEVDNLMQHTVEACYALQTAIRQQRAHPSGLAQWTEMMLSSQSMMPATGRGLRSFEPPPPPQQHDSGSSGVSGNPPPLMPYRQSPSARSVECSSSASLSAPADSERSDRVGVEEAMEEDSATSLSPEPPLLPPSLPARKMSSPMQFQPSPPLPPPPMAVIAGKGGMGRRVSSLPHGGAEANVASLLGNMSFDEQRR